MKTIPLLRVWNTHQRNSSTPKAHPINHSPKPHIKPNHPSTQRNKPHTNQHSKQGYHHPHPTNRAQQYPQLLTLKNYKVSHSNSRLAFLQGLWLEKPPLIDTSTTGTPTNSITVALYMDPPPSPPIRICSGESYVWACIGLYAPCIVSMLENAVICMYYVLRYVFSTSSWLSTCLILED